MDDEEADEEREGQGREKGRRRRREECTLHFLQRRHLRQPRPGGYVVYSIRLGCRQPQPNGYTEDLSAGRMLSPFLFIPFQRVCGSRFPY